MEDLKERGSRMAEGKIKVDIKLNVIDDNSKYARARKRLYNIYHKDMSDKEIIEKLCDEIEEYRDAFKKVLINNENIFEIKSINQIRRLLGFEEIKFDREIETINMYAEGKVIETITRYKYK